MNLDLGNGFRALPYRAVTLNGRPILQLAIDDSYDGPWVLIAPNGRAIDNDRGTPYVYMNLEEVREDVGRLLEMSDYSTC